MEEKIHYYRRFKGYDYSKGASLFISISTEPRANYFGYVENAMMHLSPFGEKVMEALEAIPIFNPHIRLYGHILMPDHGHLRVYFPPNLPEPLKTLGAGIGRFKSYTTTLARKYLGQRQLWQQGYHDRLCLSRRFIDSVERYIAYNPLKHELLKNQSRVFHVMEPLLAERLDPADYWKGIGNLTLLAPDVPIASLRVSRSIKDFSMILEYVSELANNGYSILSGFISPGEIAVRDMLLLKPQARIIHILSDTMPCNYKPDSQYLIPLQEGRLLEIARGNTPDEFSRQGCLQLNEEIVEIAKAGQGVCLYFK